jgi:hypothetical protein
MNKMAMFFEGRTELEFASMLIQEIASHKAVTIETRRLKGAATRQRSSTLITTIQTDKSGRPSTHFFILFNCMGESAVKSRMLAEYPSLEKSGYTDIVCQRDVAPSIPHSDIERFEKGLRFRVPTKPISVTFVLSVMEIEAWFLAEHTHFPRIDPAITVPAIVAGLGFDPSTDDLQTRPSPAEDLNKCYGLGGTTYEKEQSQRTINAIDPVSTYFEVTKRFPHLATMCDVISRFLGV